MVVLGAALGHNLYERSDAIPVAFHSLELKFQPMVGATALVDPDLRWRGQRTHDYIQSAVPVQVGDCRSPVSRRRERSQSCLGHQRGKFHSAQVAKDRVRLLDGCLGRGQQRLDMPASNKNVLPAVIVEISDRGRIATHGLAQQRHSAFLRHVNEISLPRIAVEGERFLV